MRFSCHYYTLHGYKLRFFKLSGSNSKSETGLACQNPNTNATNATNRRIARILQKSLEKIGPYRIVRTSHADGTKFLLENDNRALLRIFAEAETQEKAQELVDWIKGYVQS